jgi:glycosyltransferase involved in cell wall biosynthesis
MRIAHIVGRLDEGGTECWLERVLRHTDLREHTLHFVTFGPSPGRISKRMQESGAVVHHIDRSHRDPRGLIALEGYLDTSQFDAMHSHVQFYSAGPLALAVRLGIPVRVAHAHTAGLHNVSFGRRIYHGLAQSMILRCATVGLAASSEAANAMFGEKWKHDGRWRVFPCSIDLEPYRNAAATSDLRTALKIDTSRPVIGYVGRLAPEKNIEKLVEMTSVLVRRGRPVTLVIVGEGYLQGPLKGLVRAYSIDDNVTFLGSRTDVPNLLTSVMDILCLPSWYEGLPVTALEAQAAGLPLLLSSVVTREVDVISSLIRRCNPNDSAEIWADNALSCLASQRLSVQRSTERLSGTGFDVSHSTSVLYRIYHDNYRCQQSRS